MFQAFRFGGRAFNGTMLGAAAMFFLAVGGSVFGQGNVVMGLDGMIINDASGNGQPSWGGFGRFSYGGNTIGAAPDVGRYGAFTISEPGSSGSGTGLNYTMGSPSIDSPTDAFAGDVSPVTANMFPILDRGGFGANFDPTQYVAELKFKPLAGNTATQLNMTVDSSDGFISGNDGGAYGNRAAEQWQWGFTDLLTKYSSGTKDADGFVTLLNNGGSLSQAASFFHGGSHMFSTTLDPTGGNIHGNNLPDFNTFGGTPLQAPHGVVQLHLQTDYGSAAAIDNWEVKSLVIKKLTPDPREVARLDSHSGISLRFGAPFQTAGTAINVSGTDYFPTATDQVSRFDQSGFTSLTVKTTTDSATGGIALWQPPSAVVFDGTSATVDVTAKLTVPQGAGQADHIVLVVKNKSGNDNAGAGSGGDEYHFNLPLSSFNTTAMTTVSIPISTFTKQQAFEFMNPGSGLLSDFHLYYLGFNTDQGAGLVNLAIDNMRVMLPAPAGVQGDYNSDGVVDAADYSVWRAHTGQTFTLPNRSTLLSGPIGQADYDFWKSRFGAISGAGASAAVPEPATWLLGLMAICGLAAIRRRSQNQN